MAKYNYTARNTVLNSNFKSCQTTMMKGGHSTDTSFLTLRSNLSTAIFLRLGQLFTKQIIINSL